MSSEFAHVGPSCIAAEYFHLGVQIVGSRLVLPWSAEVPVAISYQRSSFVGLYRTVLEYVSPLGCCICTWSRDDIAGLVAEYQVAAFKINVATATDEVCCAVDVAILQISTLSCNVGVLTSLQGYVLQYGLVTAIHRNAHTLEGRTEIIVVADGDVLQIVAGSIAEVEGG